MPQDSSTTLTLINASGDTLLQDSVPSEIEKAYDEVVHSVASQEYNYRHVKPNNDDSLFPLFFIAFFVLLVFSAIRRSNHQAEEDTSNNYIPDGNNNSFLTYNGCDLLFTDEELSTACNKHFNYYTVLNDEEKLRFLQRLKNFISKKIFVIHDKSGFKEMPILFSAAAIQLSFGLDKYLLRSFSHIHIFPEEFIGLHPTLRLLQGNVSGHSINLSWKHFMEGYQYPENGQNLGLHEFAHAFHYQYFETGTYIERDFVAAFPKFDECGNRAFQAEQLPGNDLYSDYALTNFQEFWAESVELFFERPGDLKAKYEDLYTAICKLLNQDPLNKESSLT